MRSIATFALIILLGGCNNAKNELPKVSSGQITRVKMTSRYVDARNVDIWLPPGYSSSKKYAVVYIHDGQMLFDSSKTWNKQEWKVDEVASKLQEKKSIKDFIVVGIWNNGEYRHSEYFAQRIIDSIPVSLQKQIANTYFKGKPLADKYLKFIVDELKPYIDSNFSTQSDADNTFIMGSSMGGVISLYAICEYPHIFGGAGCMSTHWPLVVSKDTEVSEILSEHFRNYIKAKLPLPNGKKIYFDYGTKTLDSLYKLHQLLVDEIMVSKGYDDSNWISLEFVNDDHSEKSWSKRLAVPFNFLLKN